jgi:hypothetical protein
MTPIYCCHCGASTVVRTPEGDHLPRHVCVACVENFAATQPRQVTVVVRSDRRGRRSVIDRKLGRRTYEQRRQILDIDGRVRALLVAHCRWQHV